MHLFYAPNIKTKIPACAKASHFAKASWNRSAGRFTLSESESKHCIKVLRLKIDDTINLVDGKGGFYKAKIINDHPKRCTVEVIETIKEYGRRDFYLHIAIAPPKNIERMKWFLEKVTEIGIDEITPIICKHSERKIINTERLTKVITSAVKQSIKAYHPVLNNTIKFDEFVMSEFSNNFHKFIAYYNDNNKKSLKNSYRTKQDALILIGPEGDFTSEEVKFAIQNNFTEVSLGNSRLRTETAGIVACHTISLLNDN